ncbi:MAG: methyl-accepting chemotaxis protein [Oscillospiraceae bacterium]|nr:methyl-accepting chemotaxis protein [Oscillospiraceae bacterium]
MKNMKVAKKLIISFLIVIVLAVAIGTIGIIGMSELSGASGLLYDNNLTAIEAMGNLRELFANERNAVRTIMQHQDDPERVRNTLNQFAEFDRIALTNFEIYATTIVDESLEGAFLSARQIWFGDYAALKNNVFALINEGLFDEAYAMYITDGAQIIAPITAGFEESARINNARAGAAHLAGETLFNRLTIVLVAILAISTVVAMLLAFHVSKLISKPLLVLSEFMHRAGTTGDISLSALDLQNIEEFSGVKDEIGQTIASSAQLVRHITNIACELEYVRDGDLSIDVSMLSDNDTMGKSLKSMVDNLNLMFGEINSASGQVSVGSKQVADGAQSLAQGSTEQAASVEELSSSISEISKKTKENAQKAARAATLASAIMSNAKKGSQQMSEMVTAVNEINLASQSISKVIKVIDDIAFQTNILALNAAVEAARAGQHGKGFAVVAEEVRNLAAKSAEAAKDTEGLIANSMEKAKLGARIADDTAESLSEIVSGINESSEIVLEIAQSSEEQSLGIGQVNVGIDQVAQVIQQNSATAEESAAASEEMSSQSSTLGELISQFKLKETSQLLGLPPRT